MLETPRLLLRPLEPEEAPLLRELLLKNRVFLKPFNPRSDETAYTLDYIEEDIRVKQRQWAEDQSYSFGIFTRAEQSLVGRITLSRITRGPFQNCGLGYWLDERHNGRGLMSEAVLAVVAYAFGPLGFHRVEAATLLNNIGSQRVLAKAGFTRIGVSPHYLQIDGQWQDHQLFALTSDA